MLNSTSEIKNLYNDVLDALKSIELVVVITFCGIFFRVVFPSKFEIILDIIDGKLLMFMINIIDLLFASFLLLTCVVMILSIIFWVLWKIVDAFREKMKLYNEEMRYKIDTLQRGFYGCDIRFIKLSQWVITLFGLLFILNMEQFMIYINSLKQLTNFTNLKSYQLFILIVFIINLIRVIYKLGERVFYKYLYLQPLKERN